MDLRKQMELLDKNVCLVIDALNNTTDILHDIVNDIYEEDEEEEKQCYTYARLLTKRQVKEVEKFLEGFKDE